MINLSCQKEKSQRDGGKGVNVAILQILYKTMRKTF